MPRIAVLAPNTTAPAAASKPALAAARLLAIPVLGEIPSAASLVGTALTLAGVVLASSVLARGRRR